MEEVMHKLLFAVLVSSIIALSGCATNVKEEMSNEANSVIPSSSISSVTSTNDLVQKEAKPSDPAMTFLLKAEDACQLNRRDECILAAKLAPEIAFKEENITSDVMLKLINVLLKACKYKDGISCYWLAFMFALAEEHETSELALQASDKLLISECVEQKKPAACEFIAGTYRIGDIMRKSDMEKALFFYKKRDEAFVESREKEIQNTSTKCKAQPSQQCVERIEVLKRLLQLTKQYELLEPHWRKAKYDADNKNALVPLPFLYGQWAKTPRKSGDASVFELKHDGTVSLHIITCDQKEKKIIKGKTSLGSYSLNNNRFSFSFEEEKNIDVFSIRYIGEDKLILFQRFGNSGVEIEYRRTQDFKPLCDEIY
jgi:hypothetical protein